MSGADVVVPNNVTVQSSDCFDIVKVASLFETSLLAEDDVQLDAYLAAYEEIMK